MFLVTNYKFPLFSFNKIGLEIMFDKPFKTRKKILILHIVSKWFSSKVKKLKCPLCLFLDRIGFEIMFDDHLAQKSLPRL